MRLPLPLLLLVLALTAGASAAEGEPAAVNRPLLGVAGQADRFERQTGQDSQVRHIFLGWGQGSSWGSPFAQLFAGLKPIPMIHIGTGRGRARAEAITPAGIASGRGDAYLVALNQAISAHGGQVFVRVMAEMNNPRNLYAPTRLNGTSKGPSHSAAAYKQAFRRAYLILHGGDVDETLRGLGQPPVSRELAVNPTTALTVIWNPIAGLDADNPRPAQAFYPGDAYVDMVGNDVFASRAGVASHAANEALYRAHPGKPYALPEWGLSIDDPGFVAKICTFLRTRSRTKLAAYYDARPRSAFDLGSKAAARSEYRRCVTPLGGKAPLIQPGLPTSAQLRLTATPVKGEAPLDVTFEPHTNLAKPVLRWVLAYGDGKLLERSGPPPESVTYTYAKDGLYTATLTVYLEPPFILSAIRNVAQTRVRVGRKAEEPLRLAARPRSGKAPLSVSFRASVTVAGTSWDFMPGDGTSRSGQGRPPRFLGHTYTTAGIYRAVLVVHLRPSDRLLAYVDVRVR
jgi:PKD repeat protein